jgi:arylsulfatase A-like enzyme
LPRFLKRRGYATSAVGKWHLGIDWHLRDGSIAAPQRRKRDWPQLDLSRASARGPLDAGFDRFFGVDAPNYPPYAFIRDRHIVGRLTAWRPSSNPYETAGLAVPGWRADQVFARLRQEALREIDRLSRGSEPFFLYLPLTGPHHPITPGPDFQGKSGIGPYGDFVLEIDDLVGQIVDRLRRNGELDNTIIIFTSDNGSPAAINDHSLPGSLLGRHRANGDLRGLKADPYEGGLRVPLVIHWPAGGLAGESVQIVSLIDLGPTIADLIGHPLRSRNAAPAGNSFAPDLGVDVRPARRWMNGKGQFGVDLSGLETFRWRNWKLVLSATGPELYDLGQDPSEQVNRSGAKPYVVKGLMNRVEWWRVR